MKKILLGLLAGTMLSTASFAFEIGGTTVPEDLLDDGTFTVSQLVRGNGIEYTVIRDSAGTRVGRYVDVPEGIPGTTGWTLGSAAEITAAVETAEEALAEVQNAANAYVNGELPYVSGTQPLTSYFNEYREEWPIGVTEFHIQEAIAQSTQVVTDEALVEVINRTLRHSRTGAQRIIIGDNIYTQITLANGATTIAKTTLANGDSPIHLGRLAEIGGVGTAAVETIAQAEINQHRFDTLARWTPDASRDRYAPIQDVGIAASAADAQDIAEELSTEALAEVQEAFANDVENGLHAINDVLTTAATDAIEADVRTTIADALTEAELDTLVEETWEIHSAVLRDTLGDNADRILTEQFEQSFKDQARVSAANADLRNQ